MFCPACGFGLADDSRFCSQCGTRLQPAPAPPPTAPSPAPEAHPFRLPTMGGADAHAVALPMRGPSPRAMTLGGVAIALCGIAIGATVAWRAAARRAPTPAPSAPAPEALVALIEMPRVFSADAGAVASTVASARTADAGAPPLVASADPSPLAATPTEPRRRGAPRVPGGNRAPATPRPGAPPQNIDPGASEPAGGVIEPGAPDLPGSEPAPPEAPERTDATGSLDPAVIRAVYREHHDQLAACQMVVASNGDTVGTIRMRVRVGVDGRVARTRVVSNSTRNELLASCVQNTVRQWRYPQPQGGEVEFEYNFGFGN